MDKKYIRQRVEAWIEEEEMPVSSALKPLRKFDGLYPDDPEESDAYWDFIHWSMTREHTVLMQVPMKEGQVGFCPIETDDATSFAFGSADYQARLPKFDRYQYRVKKVYERVKDLAITHSCISNEDGRINTHNKYRSLVENEFQDQARLLYDTFKKYPQWVNKQKLLERLAELNSKIRKCKRIWKEYAEWE